VGKTACAAALSGHGAAPAGFRPTDALRKNAQAACAATAQACQGFCRWHPCGRHLYPIGDATGRAMGAVSWADGRPHQALEPAPVRRNKHRRHLVGR
jgi:hypothetical protein